MPKEPTDRPEEDSSQQNKPVPKQSTFQSYVEGTSEWFTYNLITPVSETSDRLGQWVRRNVDPSLQTLDKTLGSKVINNLHPISTGAITTNTNLLAHAPVGNVLWAQILTILPTAQGLSKAPNSSYAADLSKYKASFSFGGDSAPQSGSAPSFLPILQELIKPWNWPQLLLATPRVLLSTIKVSLIMLVDKLDPGKNPEESEKMTFASSKAAKRAKVIILGLFYPFDLAANLIQMVGGGLSFSMNYVGSKLKSMYHSVENAQGRKSEIEMESDVSPKTTKGPAMPISMRGPGFPHLSGNARMAAELGPSVPQKPKPAKKNAVHPEADTATPEELEPLKDMPSSAKLVEDNDGAENGGMHLQ